MFHGRDFFVETVYKTSRTLGHGIHVKQKAAQHYCQDAFRKAVYRQNNAFYIQIFPLSKAKESQKKKNISSEGHILFAFDELKCKKQLKHLVKEKKNQNKTKTTHRTSGK